MVFKKIKLGLQRIRREGAEKRMEEAKIRRAAMQEGFKERRIQALKIAREKEKIKAKVKLDAFRVRQRQGFFGGIIGSPVAPKAKRPKKLKVKKSKVKRRKIKKKLRFEKQRRTESIGKAPATSGVLSSFDAANLVG